MPTPSAPPAPVLERKASALRRLADLLLGKVTAEGLEAAEALTAFAQENRLARLTIDDGYGPQPRWEPEPVTVTLGGVAVALPAGGFLQRGRRVVFVEDAARGLDAARTAACLTAWRDQGVQFSTAEEVVASLG